ncbi:hypothetical protein [Lysinibacillus fusiformis]
MKKIITGIVAMILMFSITAQFPATAAQIEGEKKTIYQLFLQVY